MTNQTKYWTILTGFESKKWDVFKKHDLVAIDFSCLKSQGSQGLNIIENFIS